MSWKSLKSVTADLNFVQVVFADKATDHPLGKPIGGSPLEEVEFRGGQEVPYLPASCSGCPIPIYRGQSSKFGTFFEELGI